MALTAPTPPTPPTPPSVPKVVLGEGGSVKETSQPQSHGPQTDDELHEQQAREAVANGSGPLSKTTVSHPEETKQQSREAGETQKEAAVPQEKTAAQASAGGSTTNRVIVRQDMQAEIPAGEPGKEKAQTQQGVPSQIPESPGYHGMLYWGSTILAIAVLVALILRKVMFRQKGGKDALTITPERAVPGSVPKPGMTAAEALREIEEQETRQPTAPPHRAAREYAAQAAAKPLQPKSKPKVPVVTVSKPPNEKERERFEVRV